MGWHKSEAVRKACEKLYQDLSEQGIDVILDDRDIRPGVMFADWELIGVPVRITIGDRGLNEGQIECQTRAEGQTQKVSIENGTTYVLEQLQLLSRSQ
jgi:prolyl-tRNA synthetase